MSPKLRTGLIVAAALVLFALGYAFATWRQGNWVAAYDEREQHRMNQIAGNEAEQNRLRGENSALRENIAKLSASEEALKQLVADQGGNIAKEAQKLEQINEQLKSDQAVATAPADRCTRCRRFSANAFAAKLIDKPLTCADECAGTNR